MVGNIRVLNNLHDRVFNRASVLDKVVEHVTKVNQKNLDLMSTLIVKLRNSVEDIAVNLDKTNTKVVKKIKDVEEIADNLSKKMVGDLKNLTKRK